MENPNQRLVQLIKQYPDAIIVSKELENDNIVWTELDEVIYHEKFNKIELKFRLCFI